MQYKVRYLIDDNDTSSPITLVAATFQGPPGDGNLVQAGTGDVSWGYENTNGNTYQNAATVHSPYQLGQTGNNSGSYCVIMPNTSDTRFFNNNMGLNDKWCIQFWFRPDSTTFPAGGSQVNNQVLMSFGQGSLPSTTNSNNGIHIVAYKTGSDVDSIKFMKGNGTPDPNETDVLLVPSCIPTITNNSTWIFVCITYEAVGGPPTHGVLKIWVATNRNAANDASSRGVPSQWTSLTSTPTATDETFTLIQGGASYLALGYDGLSGHNQFKGAYSILRLFQMNVPSVTQLNNLYKSNALNGTTYGDVHVIPLLGDSYTFHTPGFYRYFDDNDGFIINVQTELCKYERWGANDYITHVYIKTRDGYMLCKAGFRGEKVEVLNSSLEFEITDCQVEKSAHAYCADCRYKTTNNEYRKRHITKLGHHIPEIVRNKVIVKINTYDNSYKFVMTNVDAQNLQPAQLKLHMTHEKNVCTYSGFTIHEKYSQLMISSLKDDTLMKANSDASNGASDTIPVAGRMVMA